MASELGVQTIQHTNGTTAATIQSDGTLYSTGHVIQVVQGTLTGNATAVTTVSNSPSVASGLFVNITPKSTSSKILINYTANCKFTGTTSQGIVHGIGRDGTIITLDGGIGFLEYGLGTVIHKAITAQYLDSPSTTSQIKYELYISVYSGGTAQIRDWGIKAIQAMEIAG